MVDDDSGRLTEVEVNGDMVTWVDYLLPRTLMYLMLWQSWKLLSHPLVYEHCSSGAV